MFTYYIIFLRKWACARAFLRIFHIYKSILFRLSTTGCNCRIAIFPILMYFKNFILYVIFDSSPNNLLRSLFYNTYTLSIYAAFKATTFDLSTCAINEIKLSNSVLSGTGSFTLSSIRPVI